MKGNSRSSLPCLMMVSRIERKKPLKFHLYFCLSKQLSLWTEYKLYPLPIPLEKLDDVKKIYALVILYSTYEKCPYVFPWISVAPSPNFCLADSFNIICKDSFSS